MWVQKSLKIFLWFYFSLQGGKGALPLSFGNSSGDSLLENERFSILNLSLDYPVAFFGKNFSSVSISGSGYISFGIESNVSFSQELTETAGEVIVPFLANISNGSVYYRTTKNENDLRIVRFFIRRYYLESGRFSPMLLLVTTWFKVRPYNESDTENTYQLILATDGNSSYAIFVYEDLSWSEFSFTINEYVSSIASGSDEIPGGESSNDTFPNGSGSTNSSGEIFESGASGMDSASMDGTDNGTASGAGGASILSIVTRSGIAQAGVLSESQDFVFPGSNSKNITLLNSSSNIGVEGVWLFRLHSFSPGSICSDGDVRLNVGTGYDYIYGTTSLEDFYYSDPSNDRQLRRGTVEVCYSGTWGTICDDSWDNADASVVCSQLNFSPYGSIAILGRLHMFGNRIGPTLVSRLNCTGEELQLDNCTLERMPATCLGEDAGISCESLFTPAGNCTDGEVRLVGGNSSSSGLVQVCFNNAWGTVCNKRFGTNEAIVVCHQLNFTSTGLILPNSFGLLSGPIFLENLACSGSEARLVDCQHNVIGTHECDHSQDAAVQCFDVEQCAVNNGGCQQRCIEQDSGFECSCYSGFVLNNDGITCSDDLSCANGDLRLVNGSSSMEGRVEICYNSSYHTVCDDFWDNLDAAVVCRQLGFSQSPGSIAVKNAHFGEGNGLILLDDVMCRGTETKLLACSRRNNAPIAASNCGHSEDAGVICQTSCQEGEVRLVVSGDADMFYMGSTNYDSTYYDKNGLRVGRVEICVGGRFGTICIDSWDNMDASVTCSQLGFSRYGAIAVNADSFSEGNADRVYTNVNCKGNESRLVDCSLSTFSGISCTTVGAVCQSIDTARGGCMTNETRLSSSTSDGNSTQGRLEVCINNAWGAVCDDRFGSEDASVACSQISGYSRQGASVVAGNSSITGDGPIFLSDLNCVGTETSVLDCRRQDQIPIGFHNCNHSNAVSVHCFDVNECDDDNGHCNQSCVNTVGSFFCNCSKGFSLINGFLCEDVNECSVKNLCSTNATCANTNGSFICTCNPGFSGNGLTCDEINECDTMPCDSNAVCTNTAGGFECSCREGFIGNGTSCIDTDECSLNGTCVNALCFNGNGNFSCGNCFDGFFRNGSNTNPCMCNNGAIRLVNGTNVSGRVEICLNNAYGTVCRDRWDDNDATVVCRQLFLGTGNDIAVRDSAVFGTGVLPIFLDNVVCVGSESRLLDCSFTRDHNCEQSEAAGVFCGGSCSEGDVRLFSEAGYDRFLEFVRGEAQICMGGVFGSICDDLWDNRDASVICQQLGFSPYGAIGGRGGTETSATVITRVNCIGNESVLLDCTNTPTTSCSSQEIATVICQDIDLMPVGCEDGAVRLVNGSSSLEGRLEVCFNRAWGTVCNNRFNGDDAQVVCNQLPGNNGSQVLSDLPFGPGDGSPLFIESLACHGNEEKLLDCRSIDQYRTSCTHRDDVSVWCTDINECAVSNGNCSHICVNDIPFHHCECPSGGQLDPTNTTCIFNANCSLISGEFSCTCLPGFRDSNTMNLSCTDVDECASSTSMCMEHSYCNNTAGSFQCVCEEGFVLSVDRRTCICSDGDLRLVNGSEPTEGRVEVCRNNSYGTICDDRWDVLDARVACRQLGYSGQGAQPLSHAFFGQGSGDIFIDNLVCNGSERRVFDCIFNDTHNCNHSEDAGVRCQASCRKGEVRLLVGEGDSFYLGETFYADHFYDKDGLVAGRVEVCVSGRYGTVCDDQWNRQAASVVCRQLGFSPYGAVALTNSEFSEIQLPAALSGITCVGSELTLLSCNHSQMETSQCGPREDAGVVCQSFSTRAGNCEDSSVRLVGGNPSIANQTLNGRLEICINNAWGSVCNNSFRVLDAEVACHQLKGFDRQGAVVTSPWSLIQDGPIFLDQLACSRSDMSLLECSRGNEIIGLVTCDHTQDVWVECMDVNECDTDNGNCEQNCTNLIGSFNCSCLPGYRLENNTRNCTNFDECSEDLHTCDVNATCVDTEGSFTCSCNVGYVGSGMQGSCADVNECLNTSANNCHSNATCTNIAGGFVCNCRVGFTGDGFVCNDVIECEEGMDNCHSNATCINTLGSFHCICIDGFMGDGRLNCSNVNECEGMPCGANATCEDTIGNFTCSCEAGFDGDGFSCEDINECALGIGNCSQFCNNTIGCFFCSCRPGYELASDGITCVDVDECTTNMSVCMSDSQCVNTESFYRCDCNRGFEGNGFINCTNVNECTSLSSHNCDVNAACTDTIGSFKCDCNHGYSGSGTYCDCTNGQVRLMSGSLPSLKREGRVEVCFNNEYGTVCDDLWNEQTAAVVCKMFNASHGAAVQGRDSMYGMGMGQIFLDNVVCDGSEENLLECNHNAIGISNCNHSEDAAVVCGLTCVEDNVRLVNEEDPQPSQVFVKDEISRGRVEVCRNNSFGTICDNMWDDNDASVVCRQLGFSPNGALPIDRRFYLENSLETVLSGVRCSGGENELGSCPSSMLLVECPELQTDAGVVCQDMATATANCSNGEVRLMGGNNQLEGRVEVCLNAAWGTVCDRRFNQDVATVICHQLNFKINGSIAYRGAFFGGGSGPIFLEKLNCRSTSATLLDCARPPFGVHSCDHSMDAGVTCIDFNECVDNNGGCEHTCINTIPSFSCSCFHGYVIDINGFNCTDDNECERSPCHPNATCTNTDGSFNCTCLDNFEGDGMICTTICQNGFQLNGSVCSCRDGDVRLKEGETASEGNVEVCMNNTYGAVCDDFWDSRDAEVVCRQLGFSNDSQALLGRDISALSVFLDNVQCVGNEKSLLECSRSTLGNHNCPSNGGAAVRCEALCSDGEVRICSEINNRDCFVSVNQRYLIDDRLSVGIVEVCSGGRYGTICDDVWTNQAASVVCRQLGFSPYGSIALQNEFSEGDLPILISSLVCSGLEQDLFNCSVNIGSSVSCGRFEDAAIVCQRTNTTQVNCTTGSVRLADMITTNTTAEGRVEVCINQAWGTVCNRRFDDDDAGTVCVLAGGYSRSDSVAVITELSRINFSRPIFLDELECTSSDMDILQCDRIPTLGTHSCSHLQDASVICTDINECDSENGGCEQVCTNSVGSFQCSCNYGFFLEPNNFNCSDIDECTVEGEKQHDCHANATCTNTIGSFNCTCNPGYSGNGTFCENVDECVNRLDNCHRETNATCTDTIGSFMCTCSQGFTGNGTHCTDVNECEMPSTCNRNADCVNTFGSFMCSCNVGYSGNGIHCEDIDECSLGSDNCSSNGNCTNTNGSFECSCLRGYRGDGINCTNVDECAEGTAMCAINATCHDVPGMYNCSCNTGFTGNGFLCKDVNECKLSNTTCAMEADCINSIGSFSCHCRPGFTGNGTFCEDIHECNLMEDNCDRNAECINTIGSFSCVCNTGFGGNGTEGNCTCMNGDVLLMNGTVPSVPQVEGRVEVCYNNSYHSICDDFWDENDARVVCRQLQVEGNDHFPMRSSGARFGAGSGDILLDNLMCTGNEMTLLDCRSPLRVNNCNHSEDAGVICGIVCEEGYVRLVDESNPVRIKDEISQGIVEVCTNNSFLGVCNSGWNDKAASTLCVELGFSRYGALALEANIFRTSSAMSPPGLTNVNCSGSEARFRDCDLSTFSHSCELASAVCQDKSTVMSDCSDGSIRLSGGNNSQEGRLEVCINQAFGTVCDIGFSLDEAEVVCRSLGLFNESLPSVAIEGKPDPISEIGVFGSGTGPIFLDNLDCDSNVIDIRTCARIGITTCTHRMDVGVRCPDINECMLGACNLTFANCENTIGSFICSCKDGYSGNGTVCEDIDECDMMNGNCSDSCTNTVGSFTCSCDNLVGRFELGSDERTCIDINECETTGFRSCNLTERKVCNNTFGGFECICQPGYNSSVDEICIDINECNISGACVNGDCINNEGNYTCDCIDGYENLDFRTCIDINECVAGTHNCDSMADCENTNGSFTCTCRTGFTGSGFRNSCMDINECLNFSTTDCHPNALCQNTIGSFDCQCFPGYTGNGSICSCLEGDSRLVRSDGNLIAVLAFNSSNRSDTCYSLINDSLVMNSTCRSSWSGQMVEGRVEVCQNDTFGSVCDNWWDRLDAQVVCKQLRADTQDVLPVSRSPRFFGEADTAVVDILLSDLNCLGSEPDLLTCSERPSSTKSYCDHSEDAGVKCGAICEDYSARIIVGDTETAFYLDETVAHPTYFINHELAAGRIELCLEGMWRPICQDFWTNRDASVVCHQLGFSRAGAVNGSQRFQLSTSADVQLIQMNFDCNGTENHLNRCPISDPESRLPECSGIRRNVYIACQSPMVSIDNCKEGAVRLVNGQNVRRGLVQVCINQAWGTVCSNQFFTREAQVVCSQMNFERDGAQVIGREGPVVDNFIPIFLSDLNCKSSDTMILSCRATARGITECNHTMDVYVSCEAFCEKETESVSYGEYKWLRVPAESNETRNCQFGGAVSGMSGQLARRQCNDRGIWNPTNYSECATFSQSLLRNATEAEVTQGTVSNISLMLYQAAIQANNTLDQSPTNLREISSNFARIRDNCSARNSTCSVQSNVLTNLTNVIDALLQTWDSDIVVEESSEIVEVMEEIVAGFTRESLVLQTAENNISETFQSQSRSIAYTAFKKLRQDLAIGGVTYGVQLNQGLKTDLMDSVATNISAAEFDGNFSGISLPPDIFESPEFSDNVGIVFSSFTSSQLFPLRTTDAGSFSVNSSIVAATILGTSTQINSSVHIVLQLHFEQSQAVTCVFWNSSEAGGRGNWSGSGCKNISRHFGTIVCECNHLSTFGVLANTMPVDCDDGFLPDPTFSFCIAQKPAVHVSQSSVDVIVGRAASVLCSSTGEYQGVVTWKRVLSNGELGNISEVQRNVSGQQVQDEVAGQLYAFRVSEFEVYLETRNTAILGAAVGIERHATGTYTCVAMNANENSMATVSVNVIVPDEANLKYFRFSTDSYKKIESTQNITQPLILAIYQTIILNSFESVDQEVVRCMPVANRPEDIENTRSRLGCSINTPSALSDIELESNTNNPNPDVFRFFDVIVSDDGFCDYETFETPDNRGIYNFSETAAVKTEMRLCEFGNQSRNPPVPGQVRRTCSGNLNWNNYDGSQCASEALYRLRQVQDVTPDNAEEVIGAVSSAVSDLNEDEQSEDNLALVAMAIDSLQGLVANGQIVVTESITSSTTEVVSDISTWPEEALEQNASSIVGSFEEIVSGYVSGNTSELFIRETDQLQVLATVINETSRNMTFSSRFVPTIENSTDVLKYVQSSIAVPPSEIPEGDVGIVQTSYSTPILFQLQPNEDSNDNITVDTEVIGLSFVNGKLENTSEPVEITLQSTRMRQGMEVFSPICVSWDFNVKRGNWTSTGCTLTNVNNESGVFTCACNHLTNFAVLVSINAPPLTPAEEIGLRALTIIGSVLSMAGLLLTMFTMLFFKSLRQRDASKFHAQLSFAMFLMLFVFVVGIDRTENEYACTAVSMLILYFTLASAFWMGAEAVLMFKKLIIVFGHTTNVFIGVISLICWCVPLIFPVIALTTLATGDNYLINAGYCFLHGNRLAIFLIPLFSILIFNTVIFVMVTRVLIKHSKKKIVDAKEDKDRKKLISSTLKTLLSVVSVMLMFGLTWVFGALNISKAALVFRWLFVIFATSQGFLLFIFFCVIGENARQEWKKLLTCYRYTPKKKGPLHSGISSSGKATRSTTTKDTSLTSRGAQSRTMRMAAGLTPKVKRLELHTSDIPLEMDEFSPDFVKKDLSPDISANDNLIISNGHVKDANEVHDTQLPPQILFRLRRPFFDVVAEGSSSGSSDSLRSQKKVEDVESYGERNEYYTDSGESACEDVEYSEL